MFCMFRKQLEAELNSGRNEHALHAMHALPLQLFWGCHTYLYNAVRILQKGRRTCLTWQAYIPRNWSAS